MDLYYQEKLIAKTASLYYVKNLNQKQISNMLHISQATVSRLLDKAIKNIDRNSNKNFSISVVGGVANNNYLKKCFENLEINKDIKFMYPPNFMMNDNAAMIAWATILKHSKNNNINFKPNPRLTIY